MSRKATFKATKFLDIVDDLRDEGKISANVHSLLRDFQREKAGEYIDFFDVVVYASSQQGRPYGINHLEEIVDSKICGELQQIYQDVCTHDEARGASRSYRKEHEMASNNYTFGEVEFSSMFEILDSLELPPVGGTFVDLGSGTGRAVLLARLAKDFDVCIGIELLPNLHTLATQANESFQETVAPKLVHAQTNFVCEDFLQFDWSHATVVFTHSTCFDQSLLEAINAKAKLMQPGSYFITLAVLETGVGLQDTFELVQEGAYNMTWGKASVYVHRRL